MKINSKIGGIGIVFILAILSLSFSACERNDYQHPLHRYHQQNNK